MFEADSLGRRHLCICAFVQAASLFAQMCFVEGQVKPGEAQRDL